MYSMCNGSADRDYSDLT